MGCNPRLCRPTLLLTLLLLLLEVHGQLCKRSAQAVQASVRRAIEQMQLPGGAVAGQLAVGR
jgi:hypothetical protein